jgi:hypothetical protein
MFYVFVLFSPASTLCLCDVAQKVVAERGLIVQVVMFYSTLNLHVFSAGLSTA